MGNPVPGWPKNSSRQSDTLVDAVQAAHVADAAALTQQAMTDNSGGTASTTLADITEANNAGSADRVPVENAIASLNARLDEVLADNTELRTQLNALISSLETSKLKATS